MATPQLLSTKQLAALPEYRYGEGEDNAYADYSMVPREQALIARRMNSPTSGRAFTPEGFSTLSRLYTPGREIQTDTDFSNLMNMVQGDVAGKPGGTRDRSGFFAAPDKNFTDYLGPLLMAIAGGGLGLGVTGALGFGAGGAGGAAGGASEIETFMEGLRRATLSPSSGFSANVGPAAAAASGFGGAAGFEALEGSPPTFGGEGGGNVIDGDFSVVPDEGGFGGGGGGGFDFINNFAPPSNPSTGLPQWADVPYANPGGGGYNPRVLIEEMLRRNKRLPLMDIASGIYGLTQAKGIRREAKAADPMGAYRAQFAAQAAQLAANPNLITKMPGYQAGLQAVERKMASQGYLGSGNMMLELANYGGTFFDREMARLASMATPSPGAIEGRVGARRSAADLTGRSLGSIGYGIYNML